MFKSIARSVPSYANSSFAYGARLSRLRCYAISSHSKFPATLLRINAGEAFKQFWFESESQNDQLRNYRIFGVPKDGPEDIQPWMDCLGLDRASLMPNIFLTQEIFRRATEHHLEDVEIGASVPRPFIFTIPKGTPLPTNLVLLRENQSQFSLRPSLPMPSDALHRTLDEFFATYADIRDVYEWLIDHKWEDAVAESNEREWMAR
ncbi:hypothetical protein BDV96DRAFT_624343 [Lophiotrema nucula]|uniref:Tse2 ADP-ribosyltransferase toxin domain-containing protein n=1 Tax=Lophiotrema nucula TaxID=690887 RepID=A0A6A5YRF6_9PLEO|nr:hypothetical protein BDV96DRAFT_624343 [Lophiotrema nucula]